MAFPDTFSTSVKTEIVGNPVRKSIIDLGVPENRFAEHGDALRILVLGGSQGAKALNETVPGVLAQLTESLNIHHQAGERFFQQTQKLYSESGVKADVFPFIDDMAKEYAWADIVICRAGALTVSELIDAGLGAILIPFPYAVDDHQYVNACYMEQNRAGIVIRQTEDLFEKLHECLAQLVKAGRSTLLEMAMNARKLAVTDSAERVVHACYEVQHVRA